MTSVVLPIGSLGEPHNAIEEKEERAQRKKGVVVPKSGPRRSSVGGVVAEAAKKFLASAKGSGSVGSSTERPALTRRPTLKGKWD